MAPKSAGLRPLPVRENLQPSWAKLSRAGVGAWGVARQTGLRRFRGREHAEQMLGCLEGALRDVHNALGDGGSMYPEKFRCSGFAG